MAAALLLAASACSVCSAVSVSSEDVDRAMECCERGLVRGGSIREKRGGEDGDEDDNEDGNEESDDT